MQSSLIGKIQKAKRYSEEPERITITELTSTFRGGNGDYVVSYSESGGWSCTCEFSQSWGYCSHMIALEKLLAPMVKIAAAPSIEGAA